MSERRAIVVLDDDPDFLTALTRIEVGDYDVVTFEDPHPCMDYVVANRDLVELVCIDLHMPDATGVAWQLGGLHTIQRLRQRLQAARPPICAMTGLDAVVHIHTCLKNGADGFVEKSSDTAFVVRSVLNQIGHAAA